MVFGAAHFVLL